MKSKRSEVLSLLALAATASPCAMAPQPHWYLGGNVGQWRMDFDEAAIARTLHRPTLTTTSIATDDKDVGYKLFLGYQFHRYFAVNSLFFDLGNFSFSTTTTPPGTLNASYEVKGWNLDLVGILPMTERFSAFGRVGAAYGRTTTLFSGRAFAGETRATPTRTSSPGLGLRVRYQSFHQLARRGRALPREQCRQRQGQCGSVLGWRGLPVREGPGTPAAPGGDLRAHPRTP